VTRHWVLARLEEHGQAPALVQDALEASYADLRARTDRWIAELADRDVPPGACVAICGDHGPETCALLLACLATARIAVPLTGASRRDDLLDTAEVGAVFDVADDEPPRSSRRATPATPHTLLARLRESGHPGLILFSSGSTGQSKAALLDLDRLLEKFRERRRPWRTLVFLLLDHIGGINTLLYALSNGGAVVSVRDRDPRAVCRAIERHRVELLPTTPTFLRMLLISGAWQEHDLSSLRLVTYGTEPMPESTLRHLRQALPDVRLKQTYGLSELGILQTRSRSPGSLWMSVGGEGFETKVEGGTLRIRARSAMLGYLNAPSPIDEDGWLDTGDLVEVDGEWIRVLGRKTERINVGGDKVNAADVESVLLELDNVADATVHGRDNPVTGQVVAATLTLLEPEDRRDLVRRVRARCRERLPRHAVPMHVEVSDGLLHGERFKKART